MSTCRISNASHEGYMACAIDLARQGRGLTAPNPCVGAVLVDGDGCMVAAGWHTKYGAPHAERACLSDARSKNIDPAGMTLYVTLEPCTHHGKTPPCTDALIEARVGMVVVGTRDPNPVAAGGIETLEQHGIPVKVGILEVECKDLISDFLLWQHSGSTYNIVKMAVTLDGKIASRFRVPEPVSSHDAFARVHVLRSQVGAVVVGGGTFYADNPRLTCRLDVLDSDFEQPYAVIATSRLPESPDNFTILRERPEKTIFFTTDDAARSVLADGLRKRGVRVWPLPGPPGYLNLSTGFERLRCERDCYYTLIEGGGRFAMQCVSQGLADELIHFVTPRILGDDQAPSAYSGRGGVRMEDTLDFRIAQTERLGEDLMVELRPRR